MIERLRTPTGDNYSYVLYDEPGGVGCIVDPVAEDGVREVIQSQSLNPVYLVNTHGHGDHTGSNRAFRSLVKDVICHPEEEDRISNVTRTVRDGEIISVGSLDLEVLHTPGHTSGSICLKTPSELVTGDTVFLAGCGNTKFGGSTRDLFESFKGTIRSLDQDLVLLPGHDYARRNLNFARSIEPENPAIERKLDEIGGDEPDSTLGEEQEYNPFFRYDDPDLIHQLDGVSPSSSDWDVFRTLRERRNNW